MHLLFLVKIYRERELKKRNKELNEEIRREENLQRQKEREDAMILMRLKRFLKYEDLKNKRIKERSVVKETVSENVCVICIDDYKSDNLIREIKTCKHSFHVKCIDKWFEENHSCPECRINILCDPRNPFRRD
jgi:hypothetical protein